MQWTEYSTLYTSILDNITLQKEDITYLECMYSILDGLSSWWVWVDDTIPNPLDKVLYSTGKRSGYITT